MAEYGVSWWCTWRLRWVRNFCIYPLVECVIEQALLYRSNLHCVLALSMRLEEYPSFVRNFQKHETSSGGLQLVRRAAQSVCGCFVHCYAKVM